MEAYQSVPCQTVPTAESTWYVTLEPCNHVGQTHLWNLIGRISPKRCHQCSGFVHSCAVAMNDSEPRAFSGCGLPRSRIGLAEPSVFMECGNQASVGRPQMGGIPRWLYGRQTTAKRQPGAGGSHPPKLALDTTWRALEQKHLVGANTVVDTPELNVFQPRRYRIVLLDLMASSTRSAQFNATTI